VRKNIARLAIITVVVLGGLGVVPQSVAPQADATHQVFKRNPSQSCPHCSWWNLFCKAANRVECRLR
jgi:hypothetical protein